MKSARLVFHPSRAFTASHMKGPARCVEYPCGLASRCAHTLGPSQTPFCRLTFFPLLLNHFTWQQIDVCNSMLQGLTLLNTWYLSRDSLTCHLNLSNTNSPRVSPRTAASSPQVWRAHTKCSYLQFSGQVMLFSTSPLLAQNILSLRTLPTQCQPHRPGGSHPIRTRGLPPSKGPFLYPCLTAPFTWSQGGYQPECPFSGQPLPPSLNYTKLHCTFLLCNSNNNL